MDTQQIKYIQDKIKWVKKTTFDMIINAGKGHMGGSFSIVDVLASLYYGNILNFDAKNPKKKDRDRLILSKGHANNTLYVILADLGFFPMEELNRYNTNGALLGGHCDPIVPGIEVLTGSLGHGLGIACGIAMAAKLNNEKFRTYCIIGDGESQEGSIWEAIMFAAQHKLNNLTVIVDYNKIGSENFIEDTSGLDNLCNKWKAFNWNVREIDGHNVEQIINILKPEATNLPTVVICNTIKGNGLYSLENTPASHHTLPTKENIDIIKKELAR